MIKICNDRSVFPNNIKVSNQYENDTRSIDFDLSDVQFKGNTYLICKYQGQSTFYAPLLLDENNSIPVETFLSAQAGAYTCVIVISTVTIDENYDFSSDNPLFVSNEFALNVEQNFLTGTATAWQLTPAAQNYFDQLIALVEKVQEDLDSGAFNGNGIQSITKTGSEGLVDTYQILFTNGSTFDFQVTNGEMPIITIQNGNWYINGVDTGQSALGVGVPAGGTEGQILSKKSDSDYDTEWVNNEGQSINSVQVSVSNTTGVPSATGSVENGMLTLDFQNLKGEQGPDGPEGPQGPTGEQGPEGLQGIGITSIEKTSSDGYVDTYTITFSNQTTTTFNVTNGQNGVNGQTPVITIQDGYWYVNGESTGQQAQGPEGPIGPQGETGLQGPTGATPNLQIGDVTTLQPGQQATASITGTPENPLLNLEIPQGPAGGGGVSSAYELIAEGTLEEEAKQMVIGGNLDEYGIVYYYVKIKAVDTEYYSGISFSATSSINWSNIINQTKTPINQPYFYRGRYFMEKNRVYCESGKASQYDNNARIFQSSLLTNNIIPKYLVVFSNNDRINLPVGTRAELWGVKKS